MKALILGSGMYVTGKNQSKTGTILASVIQSSKTVPLDQIIIVSRSEESGNHALEAARYTNEIMGTNVKVEFHATEGKSEGWLSEFVELECFDFSIVSLPDHLHFEYTALMLKHKVPTLVVKPLTPTLEEGQRLLELSEETETYCAVEFHKRWDESNLYLKNSIEQKNIGDVLYFAVNYSQQVVIPSEQFRGWAEKSNIFQYLGVHYVDLIYFMTGKKPKSLRAYGTKKKLVEMGVNTWDSVHVSSVWGDADSDKNDFYAHFNLNWIDPNSTTAMSDQNITVVGTEGRIDCDQKHRGIEEVSTLRGAQSINPYFSSFLVDSEGFQKLNGYGYLSIFNFVQDVHDLQRGTSSREKLNQIRPGIKSSLVSTHFIDQVSRQLQKGNTQEINL